MIKVIRGAIEGTVNQYVSRKKNPEMKKGLGTGFSTINLVLFI